MAGTPHPAVVIELSVESAPRVHVICMNEGEERRVWDWIMNHPELHEIVVRAVELAEEARAA